MRWWEKWCSAAFAHSRPGCSEPWYTRGCMPSERAHTLTESLGVRIRTYNGDYNGAARANFIDPASLQAPAKHPPALRHSLALCMAAPAATTGESELAKCLLCRPSGWLRATLQHERGFSFECDDESVQIGCSKIPAFMLPRTLHKFTSNCHAWLNKSTVV